MARSLHTLQTYTHTHTPNALMKKPAYALNPTHFMHMDRTRVRVESIGCFG